MTKPIGETLAEIGASAPPEAWDGVPPSDATPASLWADVRRLRTEIEQLRSTLRELDARLRECSTIPASAADAYDSYYQGLVAEALTPNVAIKAPT